MFSKHCLPKSDQELVRLWHSGDQFTLLLSSLLKREESGKSYLSLGWNRILRIRCIEFASRSECVCRLKWFQPNLSTRLLFGLFILAKDYLAPNRIRRSLLELLWKTARTTLQFKEQNCRLVTRQTVAAHKKPVNHRQRDGVRERLLKSTMRLRFGCTELSKNNSRNRFCRFDLGTIYLFPNQMRERNVAGKTSGDYSERQAESLKGRSEARPQRRLSF